MWKCIYGGFALILGVGCTGIGEPHIADTDQAIETCTYYECGSNSPQIAEHGFWELNLPTTLGTPGLANNVGLQVDGFVHGIDLYLPKVFGGKLTATRRATAAPFEELTLEGRQLIGGWFLLHRGLRTFRMRVSEVTGVEAWAKPSPTTAVPVLESYRLDWSELDDGTWTEFRSIQVSHPIEGATPTVNGNGTGELYTLLFEGDRIDATKKTDAAIDSSWVNFGVAGSALAKMALMGHTEAAHHAGLFETTLAERQALLKMLVADYCGDGTPFTVAGQPLRWLDDRGTLALGAAQLPPLTLEARWDEHGATCLNVPRLDAHWTEAGAVVFGADVYGQVAAHCGAEMPPPCGDDAFEPDGAHLVTASEPLAAP